MRTRRNTPNGRPGYVGFPALGGRGFSFLSDRLNRRREFFEANHRAPEKLRESVQSQPSLRKSAKT